MVLRSLVTLLILPFTAWGAGCCGGGSTIPTLITGDYRAQVSLAGSNSAITHFAQPNSEINQQDTRYQQVSETLSLNASYLLDPLWQVGLSVSLVQNTYENIQLREQTKSVGDIKLMSAYEILPEYTYNPWKPRVFVFYEQSFPTSRSTYETQKVLRTDSVGTGFFTSKFGAAFVKAYALFDYLVMTEVHQGLKRSFGELEVSPKPGYSFSSNLGFSPGEGNLRTSFGVSYFYEGGNQVTQASEVESRFYWQLGVSGNYLMGNHSFGLGYVDQTFFGKARNTVLTKSLTFNYSHFYDL